jgi:predicted transcriptional regulator of viral defense system
MQLLKLTRGLPYFFTVKDVQTLLNIKAASARVLCNRYVKNEVFVRLRRNLYMQESTFRHHVGAKLFPLMAEMFPRSYISFTSALRYHGVLHGMPIGVEAMSPTRTWEDHILYQHFKLYRLPKKYFFGFHKDKAGFTIATPEKALLDLLYLYSLGRYTHYIPFRHINLERIDFKKLFELSEVYPPRTQKLLSRLYARFSKRL